MILTDNIKKLLIQCSAGLISNEELKVQLNHTADFDEFQDLLMTVYESEDQSLFEAVLWSMPNNLSHSELEHIYSKILLMKNHREHEEIVGLFQVVYHNNRNNIQVLLDSLHVIPDYLNFVDFKYPYIRKIIYAIGAQAQPYNIVALEKLVQETEDENIKDLAFHQLKKREELGRWEAAKNAQ
jgi:hypothetical protein